MLFFLYVIIFVGLQQNTNTHFIMKYIWKSNPLLIIIILALIFRCLSVIFSKGFGMHDDHFLIIEAAQSWIDNYDYNNWLPGHGNSVPSGHSWFFPGLHYLIFLLLKILHINEPQGKMYVIRFLLAIYSLITVIYSYKITKKLSNQDTANHVGLLMALLWFMPFLSVRNLIEIHCIPPLLIGIWIIINAENTNKPSLQYFFAGLIVGIAFSIRFQTLIFSIGLIFAILLMKKLKPAIVMSLGLLLSIAIIQGITDYIIWGYPFAELKEYITYNLHNAYSYETNVWYTYILLFIGILIPPLSLYLFFGFFYKWRRHLLIFLPTFLFFVFHSIFPNKQERFILPVLPFFIILGCIGWYEFMHNSIFWQKRKNLFKYSIIFVWLINLILLPIISTTYSKRARVESMCYLSKYKHIKGLVLEDSNHSSPKIPPLFYLGQWVNYYNISESQPLDSLKKILPKIKKPDYILFFENKNLDIRLKNCKTLFPNITYETTIQPSFIDNILYKLNPKNANQTIYIYKIL
jgi:hypothetical protein